MLLGFVFDMVEAHNILTPGSEFLNSGELEGFARKFKFRLEMLDWEEFIFAVDADLPDQIEINSFKTYLKEYKKPLAHLKKILKTHGFSVETPRLIADPQWTRDGQPITYG